MLAQLANMRRLLGEPYWRDRMPETGDFVAWGCAGFVVLTIVAYVVFEVLKRWRVVLRLAALDESLLSDGGVTVETITDAPSGSAIVPGVPAELVSND